MKSLMRSRIDRRIAGVCGGIARQNGWDSTTIRLIWVALVLFGGTGLLAYAVLWIVIPEEPYGLPVEAYYAPPYPGGPYPGAPYPGAYPGAPGSYYAPPGGSSGGYPSNYPPQPAGTASGSYPGGQSWQAPPVAPEEPRGGGESRAPEEARDPGEAT